MLQQGEPMTSRYLLDPELVPSSQEISSISLRTDTLPRLRADMQEKAIAASTASDDPSVATATIHVPGSEGAPAIRVLSYRPAAGDGPLPVLLHLHGGGFVFGSPERKGPAHRKQCLELGCAIYSVEYRLAPETPFPGAIEDCYTVLGWLIKNAEELRIDKGRIAVSGESAGGGLAASLALLVRDRAELSLCFQHLISPMLDDRTAVETNTNPFAGEFAWTPENNAFGWSSLLGPDVGKVGTSPYAAAARAESLSKLPPAFLSVASLDLLLDEQVSYATRLVHVGIPVELHIYPGSYHGFSSACPRAQVSLAAERDSQSALKRALHG